MLPELHLFENHIVHLYQYTELVSIYGPCFRFEALHSVASLHILDINYSFIFNVVVQITSQKTAYRAADINL